LVRGEEIMAKIRAMEPRDIPFAIRLTDTEGWRFTRQDFVRLLRLDPSGSFVALNRNGKVGLINTTTYDHVAWIGNVIVGKAMRGKGVGNQLLKSAISYIEAKGIRTIGLYSYIETRSFYKKFGFVEKAPFLRYVGKAKGRASADVHSYRSSCLNDIVKFDSSRFGADRRKLLTLLCNEFPTLCFTLQNHGKIVGYVIAKGAQSGYEIGPSICDHYGS
jgi:predicted N-acetyltransferase YhbS